MRKPLGGLVSILLILAVTTISWKSGKITNHNNFKSGFSARALLEKYISNIYESAHLQESGLAYNVFDKAVTGFMNLKASNKFHKQVQYSPLSTSANPATKNACGL